MKTYRVVTFLIPAFIGICSVTRIAQAQAVWTHVASACTLDEASTALAQLTNARIEFRPGQIGTIYARCNVTNPTDGGGDTTWSRLEVVYNDPDGLSNGARIKATLKRVRDIGSTIWDQGIFDSNLFPQGPQDAALLSGFFDFYVFSYYVEIQIWRDNANLQPTVSAVRLREAGLE